MADRRIGEHGGGGDGMQIERIRAQSDAIGRDDAVPDVVRGQPCIAQHVPRFAHVDGVGEAADAGIGEGGYALAQIAQQMRRLGLG